ncbi:MAG: hypothetical protein Q8R02_23125 [Hyphomonadaceae bacterium]|nr:hypothetical protein [Hyphomonadaceae bacterium]
MKKSGIGASIAALGLVLALAEPAAAQRIGANSGVNYADEKAPPVEGPKTIAGSRSFESPIPFFKDLKPWDPNYKPPRTSDGKPELNGVWSTASLTSLTRGGGRGGANIDTLVIPPEKVNQLLDNANYVQIARDSQKRTDPNAGVFTDRQPDAGYNAFWIDPGSEYAKVNGEWRSSWITSPANGQIPYNRAGNTAAGSRLNSARTVNNTGPEIRTLGDRCLVSFANQGGPPLTNAMYNNNIQIVVTPDHVMLDIEMNHDARIIRIKKPGEDEKRLPDNIEQWFGDSIGWWEGDTLVVETRNPHQLQARGRVPLSKQGKVIERFKRVSDVEIDYTYEVIDPVSYTQTWTGQMPLRKSKEKVFEYACHEGNYALPGILIGMNEGRDTALEADGE